MKLLLALASIAEGFPAYDIVVDGAADHKKNVVFRYHGTGKQKPLLLLAHLDVVEAKPSDWSLDRFKLTEKEATFTAAALWTIKPRRPSGWRL
jgi:acetylornithine deacetylase/succinyl-diaminopimelate desuccinylase-like protein